MLKGRIQILGGEGHPGGRLLVNQVLTTLKEIIKGWVKSDKPRWQRTEADGYWDSKGNKRRQRKKRKTLERASCLSYGTTEVSPRDWALCFARRRLLRLEVELSPSKGLPDESQVGSRTLGDHFNISTEPGDILSRMKNCSASDHLLPEDAECRYSLHLQDVILSDEIQTQKRQERTDNCVNFICVTYLLPVLRILFKRYKANIQLTIWNKMWGSRSCPSG